MRDALQAIDMEALENAIELGGGTMGVIAYDGMQRLTAASTGSAESVALAIGGIGHSRRAGRRRGRGRR